MAQAETSDQIPESADLADRMAAFADELVDPMVCRTPAYGAPGRDHCAACCYGTLLVITCEEEQAIADAAKALNHAADLIRRAGDSRDGEGHR